MKQMLHVARQLSQKYITVKYKYAVLYKNFIIKYNIYIK